MSLGCAVPLKQNHSLLHFIFCFRQHCSSETDRWCLCPWVFPLGYLCQLIFPLCVAVVPQSGSHHSSLINGVPGLRLVLAPPPALREKMKTHSWISYKSSLLKLALLFWHIPEENTASLWHTKKALLLTGPRTTGGKHVRYIINPTGSEAETSQEGWLGCFMPKKTQRDVHAWNMHTDPGWIDYFATPYDCANQSQGENAQTGHCKTGVYIIFCPKTEVILHLQMVMCPM